MEAAWHAGAARVCFAAYYREPCRRRWNDDQYDNRIGETRRAPMTTHRKRTRDPAQLAKLIVEYCDG